MSLQGSVQVGVAMMNDDFCVAEKLTYWHQFCTAGRAGLCLEMQCQCEFQTVTNKFAHRYCNAQTALLY
ncbi:MAG: hypothetical protein JO174_04530 [Herbaspirillum sp.]|nr:hypothetical protein [Herbaspirillum sp.]